MRRVLIFLAIFGASGIVSGQDLASLERKIAKEPKYQSKDPRYALLVFGEKLATRVWVVVDGDVLYADLNANGDLTEEGEKIAKMDFGKYAPPDGMVAFEIKEIQDGELVHRNIGISAEPAGRFADVATEFLKLLNKNAKAYSYNVGGMIQLRESRGTGLDGRKRMLAWVDEGGPLQFSSAAATAPVLHFGGKLKVGLCGDNQLVAGRAKEVILGIGTPGIGAGSTVWMEYNEIPLKTPIYAEVVFPKGKNTAEARREKSVLVDRCCGFNLTGQISTPDDVGLGSAQVEFRLDSLLQPHDVAPLRTSIDVLAPKNKFELAPASKRIVRNYIFPNRKALPAQIHFSPDGDRLLAAEHPGGLVAIWDFKSAELLAQFDVGENRHSYEFLHVLPDWSMAYASSPGERKAESETLNGKEAVRFAFSGVLKGFDLTTGKQISQLQEMPPRFSMGTYLSADGSKLISNDHLSGVFEAEKVQMAREIAIWDLAKQKSKAIGEHGDYPFGFVNGDTAIAAMSADQSILKLFDIETGRLIWVHKFAEGERFQPICSHVNGDLVVGVNHSPPKSHAYDGCKLVILDAETGELKDTIEIDSEKRGARFQKRFENKNTAVFEVALYTNGKAVFPASDLRLYSTSEAATKEIARIDTPRRNDKFAAHCFFNAISPDGQWFAAGVSYISTNRMDMMSLELDPLDFPQPQLWLVNLKDGSIAEKIDLPQAIIQSIAFAPDGKSIAATGHGRVHLLDVSDLVNVSTAK